MTAALSMFIALTACDSPNPTPDNTSEARNVEMHGATTQHRKTRSKEQMAGNPCFRREGVIWVHVGWKNCLEFGPKERMRGVWVQDFEESSFLPGENGIPQPDNSLRFKILLEVDSKAVSQMAGVSLDRKQPHVVELDFIGRRSRKSGPYYTTVNDYVVVVDQLISAKYLGIAPDPEFPEIQ